jgi:predicted GNAT family N-acyltransferase
MPGPFALETRLARDEAECGAALDLRRRVFCVEQGVAPDLEADGRDAAALHVVALHDRVVIGTCRLVIDGETAKLGRMAVERAARGQGIGQAILEAAEQEARAAGAQRIALNAQTYVRDLYAREGYSELGVPFDEAGIPHVRMEKLLA